MKILQKIAIITLIFYISFFISVYFAENWKSASSSSKIIDPSIAIDSIRGNAKETIVLTPTLEQPFASETFVSPISSYGLEIRPNNQSSIIELAMSCQLISRSMVLNIQFSTSILFDKIKIYINLMM